MKYSESQEFPNQPWHKDDIKIFDEPEKAVEYLEKHSDHSKQSIIEEILENFQETIEIGKQTKMSDEEFEKYSKKLIEDFKTIRPA